MNFVIIACGLHYKAGVLVSRNGNQRDLSAEAGLPAHDPLYFQGAQQSLAYSGALSAIGAEPAIVVADPPDEDSGSSS